MFRMDWSWPRTSLFRLPHRTLPTLWWLVYPPAPSNFLFRSQERSGELMPGSPVTIQFQSSSTNRHNVLLVLVLILTFNLWAVRLGSKLYSRLCSPPRGISTKWRRGQVPLRGILSTTQLNLSSTPSNWINSIVLCLIDPCHRRREIWMLVCRLLTKSKWFRRQNEQRERGGGELRKKDGEWITNLGFVWDTTKWAQKRGTSSTQNALTHWKWHDWGTKSYVVWGMSWLWRVKSRSRISAWPSNKPELVEQRGRHQKWWAKVIPNYCCSGRKQHA